ncbi:hypothetical protein BDD43_2262 [Mucilaginibacter gracilis]|uniref:Uncharacterized protein n=1 Tax=Mucilaginibacter gracilis TaxID=423350 RepID=A0A495IZF1_9SPHI|nr:hypothetical protein [Mucilaginibacter gracilis]RKR82095.1 hypothetical protein BDD43_2262 [Mucilaginibacter gracilis]
MMRIIENKSRVTGVVEYFEPPTVAGDHRVLKLRVTRVASVPGYPQLFKVGIGEQAAINIRKEEWDDAIMPGQTLSFDVKAGGPDLFFGEDLNRES